MNIPAAETMVARLDFEQYARSQRCADKNDVRSEIFREQVGWVHNPPSPLSLSERQPMNSPHAPAAVTDSGPKRIKMEDLSRLGEHLEELNQVVKGTFFRPQGEKPSPLFNATQLGNLVGKSADQMTRLLEKAEEKKLPLGHVEKGSRIRNFTLAETRQWVRAIGKPLGRPENEPGAVCTIGNFKGGVGKTVVSMSVAQGLSLRGYNVLCIDYDPQGSLTSLFGLTPAEIPEEQTVMPLMVPRNIEYAADTLQHVIRPTYWDGVDLIPASHALFGGEFYLPMRQMNSNEKNATEPGFLFHEVLKKALAQGIKDYYDYIIIDTPPALSYMTMTSFWAADALLMPLPPEGLDFTSSAQFWSMLGELSTGSASAKKDFAWVAAVPSKVDRTKLHTPQMMKLLQSGYADMLMTAEIPETAAVRVEGMRLSTVYDISKYVGGQRTLIRAREAFDRLVDEVDFLTRQRHWKTAV